MVAKQKQDQSAAPEGSFRAISLRRRARYTFVFACMLIALVVVTILNINTGNVHISPGEVLAVLLGQGSDPDINNIVWNIRLPRILMGLLLGGALGVAGFLL